MQRANRKRVPQIVQTRAAARRRCDTYPVDQPSKVSLTAMHAQRQTTASTRPNQLPERGREAQMALQARYCRVSAPSDGFSGTGLADQQAARVTRRPSASASEILNPVTASSAINVA